MAVRKKNIPTAKKTRKLSATYRPKNLTLEQWQKGLRQQAAAITTFGIKPSKYSKGTYAVISPSSGNEYKVVYRGDGTEWNYCSCMDFRTNQLATCKHLEAVARWVKSGRNRMDKELPSYSSVYLSYRGERKLRLRIGTNHAEELRKLSSSYFTKTGTLRKGAEKTLPIFLSKASQITRGHPTTRGHDS